MVEVAGVEPASLKLSRKASTCLLLFLVSPAGRDNTRYLFGQPVGEVRLRRNRRPSKLCSLVVVLSA